MTLPMSRKERHRMNVNEFDRRENDIWHGIATGRITIKQAREMKRDLQRDYLEAAMAEVSEIMQNDEVR